MKNFLIFVAGAAVGAVASYFVVKNKLNNEHQAEIDELREMYDERISKIQNISEVFKKQYAKKEEILNDLEEKAKAENVNVVKKEEKKVVVKDNDHFVDYSGISTAKLKQESPKDPVRIITENEASSYTSKGYDLVGMSLYTDDVLIDDETEKIIEDCESWVGAASLSDIRENGDSERSVYILNEDRKMIVDITVVNERFGDDYDESGDSE